MKQHRCPSPSASGEHVQKRDAAANDNFENDPEGTGTL